MKKLIFCIFLICCIYFAVSVKKKDKAQQEEPKTRQEILDMLHQQGLLDNIVVVNPPNTDGTRFKTNKDYIKEFKENPDNAKPLGPNTYQSNDQDYECETEECLHLRDLLKTNPEAYQEYHKKQVEINIKRKEQDLIDSRVIGEDEVDRSGPNMPRKGNDDL